MYLIMSIPIPTFYSGKLNLLSKLNLTLINKYIVVTICHFIKIRQDSFNDVFSSMFLLQGCHLTLKPGILNKNNLKPGKNWNFKQFLHVK